ncbi:GspH/FimT family pseudopilin [Shewanella sp. NIFS-20-20]|uniref:GspH/FimT family pseudopilin n=1 Tax=Shewanella sp. NIFS-20-20 TaxID=2853806 RepID=UPI001C466CBA|nr:GspH/FimT family pseudopilin [Shewanella sp. NIFS-20-20]MBV7314175.1 GspH/FimT family pseudopilin [Shewanella sp. NIFS-20-20]
MSLYRPHAFSLVELMIIMTILVILILIAAPNLTGQWQAYRGKTQIALIQQTLMFARNQAISFGSRVTVCPLANNRCDSHWQRGLSVFIDINADGQLGSNDRLLLSTHSFHADDTVQFNRARIRFLPSGLSSGSNGTFTYCPGHKESQYSQALIINNAGRIRLSQRQPIRCQ